MIITIHNEMQNMGKSIISLFLANAIARADEKAKVWLVDTDPQGTLTAWAETSPNLPKPFQTMDFEAFEKAKGKPNFTIFDTQRDLGKDAPDMASAAYEGSDLILVPTVISQGFKEYAAMARAIEVLKQNNVKKWGVVFNKVKASDSVLLNERKHYAAIHGCNPLNTYISDNEQVANLYSEGTLPHYVEANAVTAEFDALWKEINS